MFNYAHFLMETDMCILIWRFKNNLCTIALAVINIVFVVNRIMFAIDTLSCTPIVLNVSLEMSPLENYVFRNTMDSDYMQFHTRCYGRLAMLRSTGDAQWSIFGHAIVL